MKMTINDIRKVIRRAAWVRNDFSGIREEFIAQPVDTIMQEKIAELQALVIPARFARDIAERDEEITYCLRTIGRWLAAKAGLAPCSVSREAYEAAGRATLAVVVDDVQAIYDRMKPEFDYIAPELLKPAKQVLNRRPALRVIQGGKQ